MVQSEVVQSNYAMSRHAQFLYKLIDSIQGT
jgi:hypothetical protein